MSSARAHTCLAVGRGRLHTTDPWLLLHGSRFLNPKTCLSASFGVTESVGLKSISEIGDLILL